MVWVSILGILPFTLTLPYVGLTETVVLSAVIGLAFGIGGIGAAGHGVVADWRGIGFVCSACSFLPLLGLLTVLLPNVERRQPTATVKEPSGPRQKARAPDRRRAFFWPAAAGAAVTPPDQA